MKRILTALVLIPLVLLAVFKAPSWLFTLLVGAVALLALKEYLDLVEAYGVKPIRWLSYAVAACPFLLLVSMDFFPPGWNHTPGLALELTRGICGLAIFFSPFLFLIVAMRAPEMKKGFPSAAASLFGFFYVAGSMACLALIQGFGWYPVIFAFFAVWAGDTVAMYTGKAIGRHKMSPRISPNKTWEGAAGSIVGSILACGLLAHFAPAIDRASHLDLINTFARDHAAWLAIIFVVPAAILLNIAAQLGDLVESLIKRGANVKDSGTVLPGHGGILDRIDALLFAAPVALVLFEFIR